jgi:hypothetical protein
VLWTLAVTLVGGTIIGALGKYVAPGGRDNIPLWLTILCGVGGMLLGSLAYAGVFDCPTRGDCTPGIDWWRHLWQVGVAAVLVVVAASVTARGRAR